MRRWKRVCSPERDCKPKTPSWILAVSIPFFVGLSKLAHPDILSSAEQRIVKKNKYKSMVFFFIHALAYCKSYIFAPHPYI
jgi:hypothetical protein